MLEVGPGHALRALVSQMPAWDGAPPAIVASLRHDYERHPDSAHVQEAAGRLWAVGASVDWKAMHAHERLRRVPIPTYPFERRRYWIDFDPGALSLRGPDPLARKADPAEWTYVPAWTRAPLSGPGTMDAAAWLVLADDAGVGAGLAARLEARGHLVVLADAGDDFVRMEDRRWSVRPGVAEDLAALREELRGSGIHPRHVVQTWGIDPAGDGTADGFARAQARGFETVAALAATFGRDGDGSLRLVVVTEGVEDVAGGDPVRPERATVRGACLALPLEHPHVRARTVDVRLRADGAEGLADQLLEEVTADAGEGDTALRGALRWVRGWQAVRPPEGAAGFRAGGAWLFSGPLAAGGDALAEQLGGTAGTRIAFVLDPAFPAREEWDAHLASFADLAAHTVRVIRAAEARGARTLVLRAAPDDAEAMRAAVAEAHAEFGGLNGIIHTARIGAAGAPVLLADARPGADLADAARELAALEAATAGVPVDFVLLQSSLVSVLGSPGLAGLAAGCALVDAWAQRRASPGGTRWTAVNWDRWQLEGEEAGAGILRADAARAFGAVAALAREPRVVVSTNDLTARAERMHSSALPAAEAKAEAALHPRPALETAYHPPTNEAEELLTEMWCELLGIEQIGIHDDFFRLGGHSLLGLQLVSRIRETFQLELPLRAIFEAPTVARLAEAIDEAILLELEELSDEEALGLVEGSLA